MFSLTRPTPSHVAAFIDSQRDAPFTYADVGASRDGPPPAGYAVDHNRVRLGSGAIDFERSARALHEWTMLSHPWASVAPPSAPLAPGTTVAVVVHHYGFWSLNACRIVYVLDESERDASGVRRAGFGYGTLPEHGAIGEERFSVEWHASDDSVWYDMYAFSRPGQLLAKLGLPFARRLQRRFAQAAKRAMVAAVGAESRVA